MSLKDLPNMTAQQVFDIVAMHLLTQMQQSTSGKFEAPCLYRGPNGLKCAAGVLIGDDEYCEDMEHHSWNELVKHGLAPITHEALIHTLQGIHDCVPPDAWYNQLKNTAEDLGLEFNHEEPIQNQ